MTLVAVVWGGKDSLSKETHVGFCSEDHRQAGPGGCGHTEPRTGGTHRQRDLCLHRGVGPGVIPSPGPGARVSADLDLWTLASDLPGRYTS